jgi:hypothetical protein
VTAVTDARAPEPGSPERHEEARSRRRRLTRAIVAVLVAGAVLASWQTLRPRPSALAATRAALLDDHRFANGPKAGGTLASLSGRLIDDGKACQRRHGQHDPRCRVRLSAAAYTSVTAFIVARCTAPGVYRARTSLLQYIDAISVLDRRPLGTVAVPSPPSVPTC